MSHIQFFESHWKKFNPWVKLKKVHFLEFNFLKKKKGSILEVTFKKKFNSLSHIQKKSSILGVTFQKVQLFESHSKKIQFFESYTKHVQFFWVTTEKEFNSLSHIRKRVQIYESYKKRFSLNLFSTQGSILWVMFLKKKVLESNFKQGSILWDIKKFHNLIVFFQKINHLSHIQFFETYF